MGKITSLLRKVEGGEPAIFELGKVVEEGGLPVSEIIFRKDEHETTLGSFRGLCYIIKYGDSDLRTVVPAGRVIDLMINNAKEKKAAVEEIPPLPATEEE